MKIRDSWRDWEGSPTVILEAPGETGVTKNHNKGSWTPREDPEVMLETHWGQDRVLESC